LQCIISEYVELLSYETLFSLSLSDIEICGMIDYFLRSSRLHITITFTLNRLHCSIFLPFHYGTFSAISRRHCLSSRSFPFSSLSHFSKYKKLMTNTRHTHKCHCSSEKVAYVFLVVGEKTTIVGERRLACLLFGF
jgi:hypothetical protein